MEPGTHPTEGSSLLRAGASIVLRTQYRLEAITGTDNLPPGSLPSSRGQSNAKQASPQSLCPAMLGNECPDRSESPS
jgi:hypothetical protein